MSRRSGGGGGGGGRRSASPTPRREPSLQPQKRQQSTLAPANVSSAPPSTLVQKPQSPGLLGQVAATAGGVAIGSAVGHVAGAAITGAIGGAQHTHAEKTEAAAQPCAVEVMQFLKCASDYPEDLNACQEFNEAIRRCKLRNNVL